MNHSELVKFCLYVHGPILFVALSTFFTFGDVFVRLEKNMSRIKNILQSIYKHLASDLEKHLSSIFNKDNYSVSPILDPNHELYVEKPLDLFRSEEYRESIHEFITSDVESIYDYHSILRAKTIWLCAARVRSWLLLSLCIFEAISMGSILVIENITYSYIPDWLLKESMVVSFLIVICIFISFIVVICQGNRILKIEEKQNV